MLDNGFPAYHRPIPPTAVTVVLCISNDGTMKHRCTACFLFLFVKVLPGRACDLIHPV